MFNLNDQPIAPELERITSFHLGRFACSLTLKGKDSTRTVSLALGFQSLVDQVLKSHRALALGVEEAIQITEEHLMGMLLSLERPSPICSLSVEEPFVSLLPSNATAPGEPYALDQEALELVFHQWLALLSGAKRERTFFRDGLVFFTKLLMLRESMHHLYIARFKEDPRPF